MKIYLSPQDPPDQAYQHISNLVAFDNQVLDHEASVIIADKFLSQFFYNEISNVIDKIISKMRLNSSITLVEPDMDLLAQKYIRDDIDLASINGLMFNGRATKSILSMQSLINAIGGKLSITEKHFDENNAQIILKAGRN